MPLLLPRRRHISATSALHALGVRGDVLVVGIALQPLQTAALPGATWRGGGKPEGGAWAAGERVKPVLQWGIGRSMQSQAGRQGGSQAHHS